MDRFNILKEIALLIMKGIKKYMPDLETKPWFKRCVRAVFVVLIFGLIFWGVFVIIVYVREKMNMYFEEPDVRYYIEDNAMKLNVSGEFRSVTLNLHPQLMVRYGDRDVILLFHLIGRYEPFSMLVNEDGEARVNIRCQDNLDEIKRYIKEKIEHALSATSEKIAWQRVYVEESLVILVGYMTESDKTYIKMYGLIETYGHLTKASDDILNDRLWECKLDLNEVYTEQIDVAIDEIVKEIIEIEKLE